TRLSKPSGANHSPRPAAVVHSSQTSFAGASYVRSNRAASGLGVGWVVIDSPRLCRRLRGGSAAVTNGQAPDGHHRRGNLPGGAVRPRRRCSPDTGNRPRPVTGGLMQYALLTYAPPEDTDRAARPIPGT